MIADLQDAGKSPDEKQRFTIRRIVLIIENKCDINNLVGKGSNPQVVLFNKWLKCVKNCSAYRHYCIYINKRIRW